MIATSRTWRYRVLGAGGYGVVVDGELIGSVQRTRRNTWNGFTLDGTIVVDEYPGSRDVAAANTIERAREIDNRGTGHMERDDIVGSYAEQVRAERESAPLDLPHVAQLAEGYSLPENEQARRNMVHDAIRRGVDYLSELRNDYIAERRDDDAQGVEWVMQTLVALDVSDAQRTHDLVQAERQLSRPRAAQKTTRARTKRAQVDAAPLATIADGDLIVFCQWYALCDHRAVGTTKHPVLGDVPICERCAAKHDLHIDPFGAQA